jgi:hypothetical protein
MSDTVRVSQIKTCDICRIHEHKTEPVIARYDAKTLMRGQWANLCEEHFIEWGIRLGTGFGQELIYTEDALAEYEVKTQLGGTEVIEPKTTKTEWANKFNDGVQP